MRHSRTSGNGILDRRTFLTASLGVAAAARALAQAPQAPAAPTLPAPSTRDFSRTEPTPYPDADIVAITPAFRRYIVFNASIKRLHTGTAWAEAPGCHLADPPGLRPRHCR